MNDDQKSFIKDMLRSEGWTLVKPLFDEKIIALRQMATTKEASTEDRWWFSGGASAVEDLLQEIEDMLK